MATQREFHCVLSATKGVQEGTFAALNTGNAVKSTKGSVSPLEHLSMSSEDWSQAATLAWLLQLTGKDAAECTVDCLRMDIHCGSKHSQRSVQ